MKRILSVILLLLVLSISISAQQDNQPKNGQSERSINDQVVADDLIVQGSLGVGAGVVSGEDFQFDTIRLKDEIIRLKFYDTSNSPSFPTNDWAIEINDDFDGGDEYYRIKDLDAGTSPLTLQAPAVNNAIFVKGTSGNVGLGTNNPEHKLEVTGDAQFNDYFYFGDESTDGNWRVSVVGGKLTFEKRVAGVWINKLELD